MSRRRRSDVAAFNLSFLDCICCGFGAIVLLLVLTKVGEPQAIEEVQVDLDGRVERLQEELHKIRGETAVLERTMESRIEQVSDERELIARLRGDLSDIRGKYKASKSDSEVQKILEGRLLAAQQRLSDEMRRLQLQAADRRYERPDEAPIGGIPVDSEYIIFVIDTSGSMQQYAWPAVQKKMAQVLDSYPTVKGIQVVNDMGEYMFGRYSGKWIPDTPARRRIILQRLGNWSPFSNSSPVEGIERSIKAFARADKKISIYVFGDEFSGGSVESVLDEVDRLNRRRDGGRHVRIHAIGFPTVFSAGSLSDSTGVRFAMLMRALCERNGGTFVGLNSLR